MDSFALKIYNDMLLSLKRGNGISGKSNAKPIFLLSIMECVSLGLLRFCINLGGNQLLQSLTICLIINTLVN